MSIERTLSIVKPNAVEDNNIGNIVGRFEKEGLRIAAMKMVKLSKERAEGFYIEHKSRSFFTSLVTFMTSGPVVLMVLEGEKAVERNRTIMGSTNPADAANGTLRKLYAKSLEANAVHGSDSLASAEREISYFFDKNELCGRF
ncbi:MAG: nucleoside-diphosphate kinase [Bdellovibrionales bacterium RIFOXYD12_FULL_39_22]|nr:MAG: nucleoside-diphosphate kinase [Bdellovibrionales bacterium RIFOXYB1_FULL_39_21]OFZ42710.1 MAG: nucleoside-diphosphate kinase [Bdellovibrionales bacterium RIFOXYC12_FULL_39_17]OFZ47269.1 MAG: nucleoside-diphosphate kinase [Bdellovibrionales bacterium RIFOXYC1_FULL_39_130]OFZ73467.1 MAG: nucleoside-diphosphate kinase [Bdellovibrionales bacterium RIFOXYC2_FULL_39_8]OFZ75435.1 MAG: nucleoside-diphosphate kinase [Bdellovibrionales bacterium RIFOXYD1_FULL_39_84]OFZ93389.1 MAG: nucleoside-dip